MRYAFVGLGTLGGHLAASLARAGFDLAVHDREAERGAPLVALGAEWCDGAAEAARGRDAVITCLPSPAASAAVLEAVLPAMAEGTTWIEMSTLGRDEVLRLAGVAEAAGVAVLEAPVTGGVHLAARGEITVLTGGDPVLVERHGAALRAMGGRLVHMGPLGTAAVIKVITNMLAFVHLVADGEALMLARRAGLDLGRAWEAIAASSGTSFVHETEGQLILNGSYDVGFTMDLALKDLGFAIDYGRELGVPLELAAKVEAIFREGRAAYGGGAQSTAIVRRLEDALGIDLRAPGFPERL
jgi:3-hydroxyisobutyrate dehydrogenase